MVKSFKDFEVSKVLQNFFYDNPLETQPYAIFKYLFCI